MEGNVTTSSPESFEQDLPYIFISAVGSLVIICSLLVVWIYQLKRRQNGYSPLNEKYKILYEGERAEKERALQRLSRQMSDRLTDGNPNITNLGDMKRPTKLAEEFSELYDNAWTDAFDSIEGNGDDEGREKIGFLLNILEVSFSWCKTQAKSQLKQLDWILSCPGETNFKTPDKTNTASVDKYLIKGFKDERKRLAAQTQAHVVERVLNAASAEFEYTQWHDEFLKEAVKSYCRQCAELCWLLVVQDPAMDIQFSASDTGNFKPFTRTGDRLDFVVWPPLYLHEGGNLMAKGIAQFR